MPAIQIRWKFRRAVIPLLANRSQQIFAHDTTAQLSCHVQNVVAITLLESRSEWNEISIEFELRWKNHQWNGALSLILCYHDVIEINIWYWYQFLYPYRSIDDYVAIWHVFAIYFAQ